MKARPTLEARRASIRNLTDLQLADVLSKPAPRKPDASDAYAAVGKSGARL